MTISERLNDIDLLENNVYIIERIKGLEIFGTDVIDINDGYLFDLDYEITLEIQRTNDILLYIDEKDFKEIKRRMIKDEVKI